METKSIFEKFVSMIGMRPGMCSEKCFVKKLFCLCIYVGMLFMVSCKKPGCTDITALNYCDNCKSEAGTCEYFLTISFYLDSTLVNKLDSLGVEHIHVGLNYLDNTNSIVQLYSNTLPISSFPLSDAHCDDNPIKIKIKYKESDMPHSCSSGSLFQGNLRCWWIAYHASHDQLGVFCDGYLIVTLSTDGGCHSIKLSWGNCGNITATSKI